MLRKWDDLPDFMRVPEIRPYYDILDKKRWQLVLKRGLDFFVALILLIVLFVPMLIIALFIKLDSPGTIFYRQERVTTYGEHFRIHKFRTMVDNADQMGTGVTIVND